jgi:ribosomal protein S17
MNTDGKPTPKQTKGAHDRPSQIGVVTSDKMQKTITVKVERLVKHPKYGKYVRRFSVLKAHDPEGTAKMGDKVEVEFTPADQQEQALALAAGAGLGTRR